MSRPKVSGDDALRAMRLADQVLRSLNSHAWEGLTEGPTGPHVIPVPGFDPAHTLRGPISWRLQGAKALSPRIPLDGASRWRLNPRPWQAWDAFKKRFDRNAGAAGKRQ